MDYQEILDFWFGKDPITYLEHQKNWFKKDPEFDDVIRQKFRDKLIELRRGKFDQWKDQPKSCLAFIILSDQFTRNIFRDREEAFEYDQYALSASLRGIDEKMDLQLHPVERSFFYMPLQHSEELKIQEKSLKKFKELMDSASEEYRETFSENYDYALQHFKIIEEFGRFPHRNRIIQRTSTPEEMEFLKKPGSSF